MPDISARQLLANATAVLATADIVSARLDARVLLAHVCGASGNDLFGNRTLTEEQARLFDLLVARRVRREPVAYITGRKEFWSLGFDVGPGVLIPRAETETLIEEALRDFPDRAAPLRVLDAGTGSGCLLIGFVSERPFASGLGLDTSEAALAFARRNSLALGVADRCRFGQSAWEPPTGEVFDVIFSNPPYLSEREFEGAQREIRDFEPREAFVAGVDGLDGVRGLAPVLSRWLADSGRGYIEIGAGQVEAVSSIIGAHGLEVCREAPDLSGVARCLVVERPRPDA